MTFALDPTSFAADARHTAKEPFIQEEAVTTVKRLIRAMPRSNQYLLLYVLDLLSVFARKSDKNLMNASSMLLLRPPFLALIFNLDLAVIFRPGLMSHPTHEMSPPEHALSQKVLEFLIAQQDWFMLDISPPPTEGEPPNSPDDDATVYAGEEGSGEGWKLLGDKRQKASRRRTAMDPSGKHPHWPHHLSPNIF